jgi:cell division protein ZapE
MADAHERIHRHRQEFAAGLAKEADPIPVVAKALASEAKLLCFDEFSVTDIADAMVLGRLFSAMFTERVRIVATSNVPPDGLYRDGLNRQLFLPFVDLLKRNMEVFELDARTDFRLEKIRRGQAYLSPLNDRNAAAMATIWAEMTAGRQAGPVTIRLKGRELVVPKAVGRSAWFSFAELCGEPRGAIDYLAIAERFDTLFIEGVPMMDLSRRNEAKRFILLIDTLYDNGIHAVISAAANPHALYQATSGVEVFEFRRTASRLIEMQSGDYEARSARPRLAGTSH